MRRVTFVILLLTCIVSFGQKPKLTTWQVSTTDSSIIYNVLIQEGWKLYSSDFNPDLGPIVTTFTFEGSLPLIGNIIAIDASKKYDDLWEGEYTYFSAAGNFIQKVDKRKIRKSIIYKSSVEFQVCNDDDGRCILYTEELGIMFE